MKHLAVALLLAAPAVHGAEHVVTTSATYDTGEGPHGNLLLENGRGFWTAPTTDEDPKISYDPITAAVGDSLLFLALAGGGSAPAFANVHFRKAEDPMVLGGWAPPPENEWAEMDPADMSETKLPTAGTLTFSATADPGPSGESFLDLVGCGRERPAGAVFLV